MITALRIQISDYNDSFTSPSTVDFYDIEVPEMRTDHVQKNIIFKNVQNYCSIIRTGYPYRIFSVKFRTSLIETQGKLDTLYAEPLYGQPYLMKLYYEYIDNTSTFALCRMLRQDIKVIYECGRMSVNDIDIRFVETTPEGVGMIQFPMLQTLGNGT